MQKMPNEPDSVQLRGKLEQYLVLLEPSEALPKLVKSARDIYEYRFVLKHLPASDGTIGHLARIVLNAIEARKRTRKVECLKVLRAIVRNADGIPNFEFETIRLLFQIYKSLIFDIPEEGQWAASVLIKGQVLDDEGIQWLIQNYRRSTHLVNRLLLYPQYHPMIAVWAEAVYKAHELPDREAEVVALLIQKDIPAFVSRADVNLLLKAVSRARITALEKETLLTGLARAENFDTLLDIALQLRMPSLISYVSQEIEK